MCEKWDHSRRNCDSDAEPKKPQFFCISKHLKEYMYLLG